MDNRLLWQKGVMNSIVPIGVTVVANMTETRTIMCNIVAT